MRNHWVSLFAFWENGLRLHGFNNFLSGFLAIAGLAATYKSGLLMILVLKKDDNFLDVV